MPPCTDLDFGLRAVVLGVLGGNCSVSIFDKDEEEAWQWMLSSDESDRLEDICDIKPISSREGIDGGRRDENLESGDVQDDKRGMH